MKYLLKIFQIAINHILDLDEHAAEKIQQLSNNVIEIKIQPFNINFFILFTDSIQLLANYSGKVNTVITSNPIGLMRLTLAPTAVIRSVLNDHVIIAGDLELGMRVKKLFTELDIDLEGQLAKVTGDVVAYKIGDIFRSSKNKTQQISQSFQENITECLQEEWRLLLSNEEINDFFTEIDDLSLRVERLSARVELLT